MQEVFNPKVVIIGSGNVAWQLALAFHKAGINLIRIVARNEEEVKALAEKTKTAYSTDFKTIDKDADIVFLCVKDDVIEEVAEKIESKVKGKIVVHTGGAVPMAVLEKHVKNAGVFYPLYSFNKDRKIKFKKIPVCIEATNEAGLKTLFKLAHLLSRNVYVLNSEQRKKVHLAAVFANNFTNHLYTISSDYLKSQNITFDILKPLIIDAAKRLKEYPPEAVQTGPAKRNDRKVMEQHLKMLKDEELKEIYQLISQGIVKRYNS